MAKEPKLKNNSKEYSTLRLILVFIEGLALTLAGGVLSLLSLSFPAYYMFVVFAFLSFMMFSIGFHILFVFFIAIMRRMR